MNGESNRKVIENYLLLLVSVYYNYLLLEDFDPLLLITGLYFENQSITYYFSITYYLLPHVWLRLNFFGREWYGKEWNGLIWYSII